MTPIEVLSKHAAGLDKTILRHVYADEYILFNKLIYFQLPKRSLRIASFCNYLRADKAC